MRYWLQQHGARPEKGWPGSPDCAALLRAFVGRGMERGPGADPPQVSHVTPDPRAKGKGSGKALEPGKRWGTHFLSGGTTRLLGGAPFAVRQTARQAAPSYSERSAAALRGSLEGAATKLKPGRLGYIMNLLPVGFRSAYPYAQPTKAVENRLGTGCGIFGPVHLANRTALAGNSAAAAANSRAAKNSGRQAVTALHNYEISSNGSSCSMGSPAAFL